jgi:hypothetical protein
MIASVILLVLGCGFLIAALLKKAAARPVPQAWWIVAAVFIGIALFQLT